MKTRSPLSAVYSWSALGLKWMEMMAASGQVLSHRTTSRAPTPAQLYGMYSEKVEAAIASSNAMTRAMIGFPTHDPMAMWNAWARVIASGVRPYHAKAKSNARLRTRR